MNPSEIKSALFEECQQRVEQRLQSIRQSLVDIEESLESADSDGGDDEMDNSRAMMQLDRERIKKQEGEVMALKELLKRVDLKASSDYVRLGSLVKTEIATYFICISIGSIPFDGQNFFCVALNSPIGQAIKGLRAGDRFALNNQEHKIVKVL